MDLASRASLEQEIYLRSLTGYLAGKNLFDGYKKVAIITYPDRICSSMAVAAMTSYIAKYGYRENPGMIFTYEEGKEKEIVKKIKEFMPDSIFIAFGGEQKMSYVANITKNIVKALAEEKCMAPLLIHVRTWLAVKKLSTLLQDQEIKNYLESLKEIRVFEANVQDKKFIFYKGHVKNGEVKLEKYSEENITNEHVSLLKISLPPAE